MLVCNPSNTKLQILTCTIEALYEAPQRALGAGMGSFYDNLYKRPQHRFCPPPCRPQIRHQRPWRLSDWVSVLAFPLGADQEGHSWPKASGQKICKRQGMNGESPKPILSKIDLSLERLLEFFLTHGEFQIFILEWDQHHLEVVNAICRYVK